MTLVTTLLVVYSCKKEKWHLIITTKKGSCKLLIIASFSHHFAYSCKKKKLWNLIVTIKKGSCKLLIVLLLHHSRIMVHVRTYPEECSRLRPLRHWRFHNGYAGAITPERFFPPKSHRFAFKLRSIKVKRSTILLVPSNRKSIQTARS